MLMQIEYFPLIIYSVILLRSCGDPAGGGRGSGPPPPALKNHKNIVFLCNTCPDPLKNHKATKPFNVGPSSARQGNAIGVSLTGR